MHQAPEGPEFARELPAKLLGKCRVLPDRENLLDMLPHGKSWCEVGIGIGDFTKEILEKCKVSTYYVIDTFSLHETSLPRDAGMRQELRGMNIFDYYRERFKSQLEAGVMEILRGDRVEMLGRLPPKCVDIFSVSFNYDYNSLLNELSVIEEKIADNGIIIINDYIMADWQLEKNIGVVRAANEFMVDKQWGMIYYALHKGMFCTIAIEKL